MLGTALVEVRYRFIGLYDVPGVILMATVEPQARLSTSERVRLGPPRLSTVMSRGSHPGVVARGKGWWLFRGMVNDIRRRAPFYMSDWADAWDYRVIPSTGKGTLPILIVLKLTFLVQ